MRKYTFVFKKKVVSDYLNNEGGYKYLAHKYQINRTLVRHWVRIYNYHGWEGLVGGGKSYTTKFKLDGIPLTLDQGTSLFTKGIISHLWVTNYVWGNHTDPYGYLSDATATTALTFGFTKNGTIN
ncbi:hypothetical protein EfmJHP10_22340 [Enterococcus faecium]|nr:hypothetical protein EfmJHP10_22340 [Enterococcus faecium]